MGSTSKFYESGHSNNRKCVFCNRVFTDIVPDSAMPMCPECVESFGKTDKDDEKE